MSAMRMSLALLVVALVVAGCSPRRERPATSAATSAAPGVAAAAAATPASSGLPTVEITAKEAAYEAPDQFPAGLLTVVLRNEASSQRNAQFFRVNDGVSLQQLADAFQQGPRAALPFTSFTGGADGAAGGTQVVTQEMAEGLYVMTTLLLGPDGQQFVPQGMVKPFRVVAAANSAAAQPAPPRAEAELTLADFAYIIPPIPPGQHVLKLVNVGQEPHEILVKRLASGKTQADALAFVLDPRGTPPYDDAGGLLVFPGGESTWMTFDLPGGAVRGHLLLPRADERQDARRAWNDQPVRGPVRISTCEVMR